MSSHTCSATGCLWTGRAYEIDIYDNEAGNAHPVTIDCILCPTHAAPLLKDTPAKLLVKVWGMD